VALPKGEKVLLDTWCCHQIDLLHARWIAFGSPKHQRTLRIVPHPWSGPGQFKASVHRYPKAEIRVVAQTFQKRSDSLTVTYCGLKELVASVNAAP
jgi:hypothetical protein